MCLQWSTIQPSDSVMRVHFYITSPYFVEPSSFLMRWLAKTSSSNATSGSSARLCSCALGFLIPDIDPANICMYPSCSSSSDCVWSEFSLRIGDLALKAVCIKLAPSLLECPTLSLTALFRHLNASSTARAKCLSLKSEPHVCLIRSLVTNSSKQSRDLGATSVGETRRTS